MANKYTAEMIELMRNVQNIHYVAPEDIPNIELYMDQITNFMDEHLCSSKRHSDDKTLTKTMINNYTKNELLPPSDKKKYSAEHMVLLVFIYYLKSFLPMNDIKSILDPITANFFDNKDGMNMESVYREIFDLQKNNIDSQVRDMIRKLNRSNDAFRDIKDEKERKLMTDFAFICMLSFDIWVKKTMIENIIDKKLK